MNQAPNDTSADREISQPSNQSPDDSAALAFEEQQAAKLRSGANWFFWIAALSVVNSFILLAEGDRSFVIGLGITQLINAFALAIAKNAPETAIAAKAVAVVLTCVIAAVVATFGWGARRRLSWVFILGMILYALDGLIYLLFADFLSMAFHGYALWCIFGGFRAAQQLNAMQYAEAAHAD